MAQKKIHMPYWRKDEDEYWDSEKQHPSFDLPRDYPPHSSAQSSPASYSSRLTADSGQPMLQDGLPRRTPSRAYSYNSARFARRFSRYFAVTLGALVLLFIFSLVHLSNQSTRQVARRTLRRPPPSPRTWESFPFLKRYHGGLRTLTPYSSNSAEYPTGDEATPELSLESPFTRDGLRAFPSSQPFIPYPDYHSTSYESEFGPLIECFLDENGTQRIPRLQAYSGVPQGMPENVVGSYEILGLRDDICFDRFGKLGPYGLGYSRKMGGSGAGMEGDREGIENVWADNSEVDFRQVNWAEAQQRCLKANDHRFRTRLTSRSYLFLGGMPTSSPDAVPEPPEAKLLEKRRELEYYDFPVNWESRSKFLPVRPEVEPTVPVAPTTSETSLSPGAKLASPAESTKPADRLKAKRLLPRTAVLLRTWHDYPYDDEDLFYLRSLISELSIMSGGEYEVHFLIHVKDDDLQIWADEETHQRVLDDSLPREFRGMGTLWSERQMSLIYGGLKESFYRERPVYGVYRSTFMPVQHFAHQHPEYEFFWNWEMDARYTGHYYHLFDKVSAWAKQQPRKGLWERNARFYVPTEHGSWEDFKHMVRVQTEHGTSGDNNIWNAVANNPGVPDHVKAKHMLEKPIWGPQRPGKDEIELDPALEPPSTYAKDNYEWGVGEDADLIVFNPLFDPDQTGWLLAEDVTGYATTDAAAEIFPPRRTAIITASRLSRRLLNTMHRETALKRHTMFSEMWPGSVALQHGLKAVYAPHPMFIDRRWPTPHLAATFNSGRNGATGGAPTCPFNDEHHHNFLGVSWYYHAGFPANLWRRWLGYRVDGHGGEEEELAGEGRMCLPAMLLHPVKQVDLVYEHREGE